MQMLNEILDILNANEKDTADFENERMATFKARNTDRLLNGNDGHNDGGDTRGHCFTFTNAWETPQSTDLNSLKLLKTSLRTDADQANHDHALQYFDVIVNDFPGEYFLQSPYIFVVSAGKW